MTTPTAAGDRPTHPTAPELVLLETLAAPGPSPSLGDAAAFYSWLVGSWDAEVVDFPPAGPPLRNRGEWHFAWILEGRALGDVWIVPPRAERSPGGEPGPADRYGMTVRVYDRALDAWRVTWLNPVTGVEERLIGRRVGEELVHTGEDAEGRPVRWTFSEIRPDSFVWRGESSRDGGCTFRLEAEFRARRRPQAASGVPDAPWLVRWAWADRPGLEALVVAPGPEGVVAESEILVVLDGVPTRIGYRFTYDRGWEFRRGRVQASAGGTARELEVSRDAAGEWWVNGEPRPDLAGCTDLDFMATPFTNTPPLRRLDIAPGEAATLRVAWVRVPDLAVAPVRQEYRRLDGGGPARRFLYRNLESGFEGELTVDGRLLVDGYGPWRLVAGPTPGPAAAE